MHFVHLPLPYLNLWLLLKKVLEQDCCFQALPPIPKPKLTAVHEMLCQVMVMQVIYLEEKKQLDPSFITLDYYFLGMIYLGRLMTHCPRIRYKIPPWTYKMLHCKGEPYQFSGLLGLLLHTDYMLVQPDSISAISQEFKGIRHWTINQNTFPMMIANITTFI